MKSESLPIEPIDPVCSAGSVEWESTHCVPILFRCSSDFSTDSSGLKKKRGGEYNVMNRNYLNLFTEIIMQQ